tara:strand:+ start:58 stop:657 length:600 start_codon:yes stop_codon:yes gene_type:complete
MDKFTLIKYISIGIAIGVLLTLFINRERNIQYYGYNEAERYGVWHFEGGFRELNEFKNDKIIKNFTWRDYAIEISKSDKMQRIEINVYDSDNNYIRNNVCNKARDGYVGDLLGEVDLDKSEWIWHQDVDHLDLKSTNDEEPISNRFYIYKSLLELGHYYDTLYQYRRIGPDKKRQCFVYLKKEDLKNIQEPDFFRRPTF